MPTLAAIQFTGSLHPLVGLALALLFAAGTWWLYRREVASGAREGKIAWLLPLLRVGVVVLVILMLTGPVLRYRSHEGEPGRVLIFVDASESMAMDDHHMDAGRKLLIARRRGWLDEDAIDLSLHTVADALGHAADSADDLIEGRFNDDRIVMEFAEQMEKLAAELRVVDPALLPSRQQATVAETGSILREYWLDVPGGEVSDLTGSARFRGPPSGSHTPQWFEAPANFGDAYGARFRGYVHPPVSGRYTFTVTGDEAAELWLSSDDDPANKRRLVQLDEPTAQRGWSNAAAGTAPLVGGRRYYIELLHKENRGDDHAAVGWQLPVGAVEQPIPGKRLSPYTALSAGESPSKRRDAMAAAFERELAKPAKQFALRAVPDGDEARRKHLANLAELTAVARRWQAVLSDAFSAHARRLAGEDDRTIREAITQVDQFTRWQRARAALLDDDGLIDRLIDTHRVEIYALHRGDSKLLWLSAEPGRGDRPLTLELDPAEPVTDLATGLAQRITTNARDAGRDDDGDDDKANARTAVVLFSDGDHNLDAAAPRVAAATLGDRRVAVHTVGLGSLLQPRDLALAAVDAPQAVFYEDRAQGEIVLADHMPPGTPFTVTIEHDGKPVWSEKLVTDRGGERRVPFDLAVKPLIEKQLGAATDDVRMLNVPMALTAKVSLLDGEAEAGNNAAGFTVQAITEPRRALLLDGRPRWEARYVRNLFDRDNRWQINALLAGVRTDGRAWPRGEAGGAFPATREQLFKYDMILLGDLPRAMLGDEELAWLRDYVGQRGGGLVLIDGRRGHLRGYADSPINEVLPIEWTSGAGGRAGGIDGAHEGVAPTALRITETGASLSAFRMTADPGESRLLWSRLRPPHWVARVRALPGTETIIEAVDDEGGATPAIVQRSYGAGRVVYLGFDESWRWRYEVADRYHGRFWNQLGKWVGEAPYAVQDQYVKLDAGKPTYQPGERAEIRARLRDRDNQPLLDADAVALIYRDGRQVATVPLEPDEKGGVYRARTPTLTNGSYEIGLRVSGFRDDEMKARATFTVEEPQSLERRSQVMNETLLRAMARAGRGGYYREENVDELIARLAPLARDRMEDRELVLWRSYFWFVPIIALLTAEWIIRKRAGLL